jgi:O-Antigen ligase
VSPRIDSSTTHLSPIALWLERAILSALFLFVFFAPNSIAFTQAAWCLGLLFWIFRFAVWPRPALSRTPLDYALFGFFLLTALSSFVSYEPIVSIGKLRQASLFTIVYLFAENVRSNRVLRALVLVLIAGSVVNVLYTFGQYAVGRGVKVYGVAPNSPLAAAQFVGPDKKRVPMPIKSEDTLLEVDGQKLRNLEELAEWLYQSPLRQASAKIKIYRVEWVAELEVPKGQLLPGKTTEARLGIQRWTFGRDWRATGFYDHWTTYAESLQLLASLVIGLFVALPQKQSRNGLLLGLAIAGMCGALLLSVTRASWLGLVVSAVVIATIGLTRRALMLVAACALVLVVAGAFILQHKRNVGFFDQKDDSILWRETVQKEGVKLLVSSPRHLLVGIGMDSIKAHWREWGLFENGRIPMGHMHSDYLQIALERGVPALIVWLILMGMYAHLLWRTQRRVPQDDWIERGVTLGALGGLIGFMLSGFVHYNWGDSEVGMIFYLIMGLSLVVERQVRNT